MKSLLYALLVLAFVACNNEPPSPSNDSASTTTAEPNADAPTTDANNDATPAETSTTAQAGPFNASSNFDYDVSKLEHQGEVVDQRFWQDDKGQNIALFTLTGGQLSLYHYTVLGQQPQLVLQVDEAAEACDGDLTLEFIQSAFSVTDLDNDNIGELTFAHKKGCRSDQSPLDLKVLVVEEGVKYGLTGKAADLTGAERSEARMEASTFAGAPEAFSKHAQQVWDDINQ